MKGTLSQRFKFKFESGLVLWIEVILIHFDFRTYAYEYELTMKTLGRNELVSVPYHRTDFHKLDNDITKAFLEMFDKYGIIDSAIIGNMH